LEEDLRMLFDHSKEIWIEKRLAAKNGNKMNPQFLALSQNSLDQLIRELRFCPIS
jgi:hypothetical protein